MNGRVGLHALTILFPQIIARAVTRRLHHVHCLCFPRMGFASFT